MNDMSIADMSLCASLRPGLRVSIQVQACSCRADWQPLMASRWCWWFNCQQFDHGVHRAPPMLLTDSLLLPTWPAGPVNGSLSLAGHWVLAEYTLSSGVFGRVSHTVWTVWLLYENVLLRRCPERVGGSSFDFSLHEWM